MRLLHALVGRGRKPEYTIETSVWQDQHRRRVFKRAVTPLARHHIQTIVENCQILNGLYGEDNVAQSWQIDEDCLEMEYVGLPKAGDKMPTVHETMLHQVHMAMKEKDLCKFSSLLTLYRDKWIRGGTESYTGICNFEDTSNPGRNLNIDLTLDNLAVVGEEEYKIIDYEWLYAGLPGQFTFYRGLFELIFRLGHFLPLMGLKNEDILELSVQPQQYKKLNSLFSDAVGEPTFLRYIKKTHNVQWQSFG